MRLCSETEVKLRDRSHAEEQTPRWETESTLKKENLCLETESKWFLASKIQSDRELVNASKLDIFKPPDISEPYRLVQA